MPRTRIHAGCEAYVTPIRSSSIFCDEPLDFTGVSISYLDGTVFPLTEQARQISAKFT